VDALFMFKIVNSAILLHCVDFFFFFFFSVLIFLKKTSLEWILYMIIFYLILLHAKKLWKL